MVTNVPMFCHFLTVSPKPLPMNRQPHAVSVPNLCLEKTTPQAQSLGIRQGSPRACFGRSNPFRPTTRAAGVISPGVAVTVQTVEGGPWRRASVLGCQPLGVLFRLG